MKDCSNCKNFGEYGNCFACIGVVDKDGNRRPSMWAAKEDANPYWKNICALAEKQRSKGIDTYGQGLEDNPLTIKDRLEYLEEELIDGLMYIEHIKAKLIELGGDTDGCDRG